MSLKHLQKWIFLGYLVLLLNLGPVAHRAHFFGVHLHDSTCASHHHGQGHDHHSHQHEHFHGDHYHVHGCSHDHGENLENTESLDGFLHKVHDCSLCEFFDHFNVVVNADIVDVVSVPVRLRVVDHVQPEDPQAVLGTARGPPALIIA